MHHIALLIGYGAAAVNPYLAMETVEDLAPRGDIRGVEPRRPSSNLVKALGKGVLKVMSKMGVSHRRVLHRRADLRGGRPSAGRRGRVLHRHRRRGSAASASTCIAEEVALRHRRAYPADAIAPAHRALEVGGEYQWRREGELHLFNPETVFRLQHATRPGRYDIFKQYTERSTSSPSG